MTSKDLARKDYENGLRTSSNNFSAVLDYHRGNYGNNFAESYKKEMIALENPSFSVPKDLMGKIQQFSEETREKLEDLTKAIGEVVDPSQVKSAVAKPLESFDDGSSPKPNTEPTPPVDPLRAAGTYTTDPDSKNAKGTKEFDDDKSKEPKVEPSTPAPSTPAPAAAAPSTTTTPQTPTAPESAPSAEPEIKEEPEDIAKKDLESGLTPGSAEFSATYKYFLREKGVNFAQRYRTSFYKFAETDRLAALTKEISKLRAEAETDISESLKKKLDKLEAEYKSITGKDFNPSDGKVFAVDDNKKTTDSVPGTEPTTPVDPAVASHTYRTEPDGSNAKGLQATFDGEPSSPSSAAPSATPESEGELTTEAQLAGDAEGKIAEDTPDPEGKAEQMCDKLGFSLPVERKQFSESFVSAYKKVRANLSGVNFSSTNVFQEGGMTPEELHAWIHDKSV